MDPKLMTSYLTDDEIVENSKMDSCLSPEEIERAKKLGL